LTLLRAHPNTLVAVALCACVILAVRSDPAWTDTAVLTGIDTLIALSAGLSFGQAGILSMAQGAFAALGAYAAALAAIRLGLPGAAGLALALAVPAAIGYALARALIRLSPLATALATLALGSLVDIVLRGWESLTGGYIGLAGIPGLGLINTPLGYLLLVCAMLCISVFGYENLMHSRHGRALNVIRHDRARARADGVDVNAVLSTALALSAAMAGSAGWVYAHYISYLGPDSLTTNTSIAALLTAVIGGAGYILGPVFGTVLFEALQRFLPAQEAQGLFYGGALVVILLVARQGLLGLAATSWRGRRRLRPVQAPASAAV